jgi:hypothetical protein
MTSVSWDWRNTGPQPQCLLLTTRHYPAEIARKRSQRRRVGVECPPVRCRAPACLLLTVAEQDHLLAFAYVFFRAGMSFAFTSGTPVTCAMPVHAEKSGGRRVAIAAAGSWQLGPMATQKISTSQHPGPPPLAHTGMSPMSRGLGHSGLAPVEATGAGADASAVVLPSRKKPESIWTAQRTWRTQSGRRPSACAPQCYHI